MSELNEKEEVNTKEPTKNEEKINNEMEIKKNDGEVELNQVKAKRPRTLKQIESFEKLQKRKKENKLKKQEKVLTFSEDTDLLEQTKKEQQIFSDELMKQFDRSINEIRNDIKGIEKYFSEKKNIEIKEEKKSIRPKFILEENYICL